MVHPVAMNKKHAYICCRYTYIHYCCVHSQFYRQCSRRNILYIMGPLVYTLGVFARKTIHTVHRPTESRPALRPTQPPIQRVPGLSRG